MPTRVRPEQLADLQRADLAAAQAQEVELGADPEDPRGAVRDRDLVQRVEEQVLGEVRVAQDARRRAHEDAVGARAHGPPARGDEGLREQVDGQAPPTPERGERVVRVDAHPAEDLAARAAEQGGRAGPRRTAATGC
jgi:hypothetical protein